MITPGNLFHKGQPRPTSSGEECGKIMVEIVRMGRWEGEGCVKGASVGGVGVEGECGRDGCEG